MHLSFGDLPIIESSILTGDSLVEKIQEFVCHINMFLYFEVRHMRNKFCQLPLIQSLFLNSPISVS